MGIVGSALAALEQITTRPFRAALWQIAALTLLGLAVLWAVLERVVIGAVHPHAVWLATTLHVLAGIGLFVGAIYLVPTVSFVVGGLFFDRLAAEVERDVAGPAGIGRPMPVAAALWVGTVFGLLALAVNAVALALLLVPVVNIVALFAANAFLFGRGFFELAALRYLPLAEVRVLRRRHAARILAAGCVIAAFASVPLLNLLTPLFAPAFMVRVAQPVLRLRLAQRAV